MSRSSTTPTARSWAHGQYTATAWPFGKGAPEGSGLYWVDKGCPLHGRPEGDETGASRTP